VTGGVSGLSGGCSGQGGGTVAEDAAHPLRVRGRPWAVWCHLSEQERLTAEVKGAKIFCFCLFFG